MRFGLFICCFRLRFPIELLARSNIVGVVVERNRNIFTFIKSVVYVTVLSCDFSFAFDSYFAMFVFL